MRILVLANSSGGLYHFRKELLQKLFEGNEDIYISVPYGNNAEDLIDIGCKFINTNIDRRGINPVTDLKLITKYLSIIKEIKPDMIITYTIKANIYGGIAARLKKVPLFGNITGLGTAFQKNGLLTMLVTVLYRFAMKKARVVFFENVENKRIMISKKIVSEKQAYCLNGAGVNLQEFSFADYCDDETIHFLFIGRIMKEKGIDELFAAAERLKKDNFDFTVDIVGTFEDNYKDIVTDLQNRGIINFYGFQSDVKPYVRNAHCFVLPSYHEGMANTLLECGAMGRPIITSNIHGCLEAVIENETGFLCGVQNVDDLYKQMKRFIMLPYEKKVEMGKKSHEHISKVFDKHKVVDDTVKKIFEKV